MASKSKKFEWLEQAKDYIKKQDDYFEEFLANQFDDNYYGECILYFNNIMVEVESIWTDDDNHIFIHVCSEHFEGDIIMKSISTENQCKIIDMLWQHVDNE